MPKEIEDFLEKHKEKSLGEIKELVRKEIEDSEAPKNTDYRILLNRLVKLKD
jgi:hypothetical protein